MTTTTLAFDPTGWLEINYLQTIQLPDVVVPAKPALFDAEGNEVQVAEAERTEVGGTQIITLQSTSYHPTQLELIHTDCATHGATIEGADAEAIADWVADYVPPAPPAPTLEDFDRALTAHLNAVAQSRFYDSYITCSLRAGKPGPFRAEGDAFYAWMEACNETAYSLLDEVKSGLRPMPSDPQELINALPKMVWPE